MWREGRARRGTAQAKARDGSGPRKHPDWGRGGCLRLRGGTGLSACGLPVPCLRPGSAPDAGFSVSSADLDAEHAQKVLEMEHAQQAKLKERQKFFEEAFQQDMEQYLSTGYLQIAERRGKWRGVAGSGALRGHGDGVTLRPPGGRGVKSPEVRSGVSPQNSGWARRATSVLWSCVFR